MTTPRSDPKRRVLDAIVLAQVVASTINPTAPALPTRSRVGDADDALVQQLADQTERVRRETRERAMEQAAEERRPRAEERRPVRRRSRKR